MVQPQVKVKCRPVVEDYHLSVCLLRTRKFNQEGLTGWKVALANGEEKEDAAMLLGRNSPDGCGNLPTSSLVLLRRSWERELRIYEGVAGILFGLESCEDIEQSTRGREAIGVFHLSRYNVDRQHSTPSNIY